MHMSLQSTADTLTAWGEGTTTAAAAAMHPEAVQVKANQAMSLVEEAGGEQLMLLLAGEEQTAGIPVYMLCNCYLNICICMYICTCLSRYI